MGSESNQIRNDIEAKREDILSTVMEIGNRVDVPRATFMAGVLTGIMLLALLNRIQFRRSRK